MTRDDIIRMAREAGFREPNPHDGCMGMAYDYRDGTDTGASLERFAALVAAAERNKLAAWMIQFGFATGHGNTMEELVDALGSEIVDRIEFEIDAAVARDRKDRA